MAQQSGMKKQTEETLTAPLSELSNLSDLSVDKVKEVGEDVLGRAGEYVTAANKNLKKASKQVTTLIKGHPVEAIAIGFGVGVLAAFLISRRS